MFKINLNKLIILRISRKEKVWAKVKKAGIKIAAVLFASLIFGLGIANTQAFGKSGFLFFTAADKDVLATTSGEASASDYDLSGSFTKTDFEYDASSNKIFGKVAVDGNIYYGKFDGISDDTFAYTGETCDGRNQFAKGWVMERKYISTDKYQLQILGHSKSDCGLGSPESSGWLKINPQSGWKITDNVKCVVNGSRGNLISTYCTVDKTTGEIEWRAGSDCYGCCACGDGAGVDIRVVVEKNVAESFSSEFIMGHYYGGYSVKKGEENAKLQEIKLIGTSSEDVRFNELDIVVNVSGYGDNLDKKSSSILDALYLYQGDTLIEKGDASSSPMFVFNNGFTVPKNGSITLTLSGDVSSSTDASSFTIGVGGYKAKGIMTGEDRYIKDIDGSGVVKLYTGDTVPDSDASNQNCSSQHVIPDGGMIRLYGGIDVYIVKYKNCKQFKRLILSPSVFRSYGHLKWGDIVNVDGATFDTFATSDYVYVAGDSRVWKLTPLGDVGVKAQVTSDYDPDSVYEINATDRDSYRN